MKQASKVQRGIRILTVLLAAILTMGLLTACSGGQGEKKYTLYFGLGDATTGEQILTVDEASARIRAIFNEKGYGYTEYTTVGAYVDNGKVIEHDTLVYLFIFHTKAEADELVGEIKQKLNLASALVEEAQANYYFAE